MIRVYLDVNILIDIFGKREPKRERVFEDNKVIVSVLSVHILAYILKWKIPNKRMEKFVRSVKLIDFDARLVNDAAFGPTDDFEDNIQLHSAVAGDCDVFLTADKRLLKMKYFGRMRVSDRIESDE